jgi:anti-anti-sigma factor
MDCRVVENENGVTVFEVEGEIDALTASTLRQQVEQALAKGMSRCIFQFSKVRYVSSAGLGVILLAQQETRGRGGETRVCELTEPVRRVFLMAGFDQFLGIYASLAEAQAGW